MSKLLSSCLAVLVVFSPSVLAANSKRSIDLSSKGARVYRANGNAALTAPSRGARAEAVRSFLSQKGRGPAAQSLQVIGENPRGAVTHLRFSQNVAGLPVYGTYVKASVDDRGRVLSVIENIVDPAPIAVARISGEEAVTHAIGFHHPGRLANGSFWFRAPSATRVAVPLADGSLTEDTSSRRGKTRRMICGTPSSTATATSCTPSCAPRRIRTRSSRTIPASRRRWS